MQPLAVETASGHFDSASSFCTTHCCSCAEELARVRHELVTCKQELVASQLECSRWQQDLKACQAALRKRESELWVYRDALMSDSATEAFARSSAPAPIDVRPSEQDDGDHGRRQTAISEYTLLTDFMPAMGGPLQTTVEQVNALADSHCLRIQVWVFAELEAGETLQQHVIKQIENGTCPDPSVPDHMKFISKLTLQDLKCADHEEAAKLMASWYRNLAALWTEWQTSLKNLLAGQYEPFMFRAVFFGEPGKDKSKPWNIINWPTIITGTDGKRYWGMIRQNGPASLRFQLMWSMRDLLIVKHSPVTINTVAADDGTLLWQNAASTATFGCHGLFNSRLSMVGWDDNSVEPDAVAAAYMDGEQPHVNFMELLMGGDQEKLEALRSTVQSGKIFNVRLQIVDPTLRSWMNLLPDEEVHYDVQITLSSDPITLQRVFTVSQVDVTDVVLAQRQLAEEKQRTDMLLDRQYELIACLGKVTEVAQSPANNASAAKLLEGVRRKIATLGMEERDLSSVVGKIEVLELLGEGSYGKVYKGLWRGTVVAVKSMMLPFGMTGVDKHERMAIMEAALSASLSHPNIVQTYTHSIQPVRDTNAGGIDHQTGDDTARALSQKLAKVAAAAAGSPAAATVAPPARAGLQGGQAVGDRPSTQRGMLSNDRTQISVVYPGDRASSGQQSRSSSEHVTGMRGFEMRLVLEFCDCGTLRDALDNGAFLVGREVNYPAVCETAADIAKGMLQLHSMNVVHSDLKARNVLLKSNASEARGVTAKIADFGLSFKMDNQETHMSSVWHGTLTHMAPEVLLQGCQSKASDVYAFGITMWELYTAGRPFLGVPQALIGHHVTSEGRRPIFASDAPAGYVALAQRCWDQSPANRPDFEEILSTLLALRKAVPESTEALRVHVTQASYGAAAPSTPVAQPVGPCAAPFAQQQQQQALQTQQQQQQQQQQLMQSAPVPPPTVFVGALGAHSATRLVPSRPPSNTLEPLAEEDRTGVSQSGDDSLSPAIICTAAGSTMWDAGPLMHAKDGLEAALVIGGGSSDTQD